MGRKNSFIAGLLALVLFPFPVGHLYVRRPWRGVVFSTAVLVVLFGSVLFIADSPEDIDTLTAQIRETGALPTPVNYLYFGLHALFIADCMLLARAAPQQAPAKPPQKKRQIRFPIAAPPKKVPNPFTLFKNYRCPNCKTGLLPGTTTCPQCGTPLKTQTTQPPQSRTLHMQ